MSVISCHMKPLATSVAVSSYFAHPVFAQCKSGQPSAAAASQNNINNNTNDDYYDHQSISSDPDSPTDLIMSQCLSAHHYTDYNHINSP